MRDHTSCRRLASSVCGALEAARLQLEVTSCIAQQVLPVVPPSARSETQDGAGDQLMTTHANPWREEAHARGMAAVAGALAGLAMWCGISWHRRTHRVR